MYNFLINNSYKLIISLLIISIGLFVFNNNQKDKIIADLKNQNSFYKMNNSINTNEKIFMIGNSITASADWPKLLSNFNTVNMGSPGITTLDAVMNVKKLLPENPKSAFIMLGVNDIKVKVPWEVAYQNFYSLIYTFKSLSPKTEIFIISVLPTNYLNFNIYDIDNSEIVKLNQSLNNMSNKYNLNFINCHDDFLNENGDLDEKFTYDGLHLNQIGYTKLASWIKPNIDS
jgi:lysophospholipase L1-like esterase